MLEQPQLVEIEAQLTAVIHLTVPGAEMQNVMGPAIGEVMAALEGQGVAAAGPWFTHHLRMDPDLFDFEVGVPVAAPVQPVGRVRPSELPAMLVARTVYHGSYEGLGPAWGEFDAWVAAAGHQPAPDLLEVYLVGPESAPDPAAWRTQLNRPLITA